MDAPFSFNRSIRIRSRRDRITGDSVALTGRELLGRSRVVRFLAKRLPDKRDGRRIRHSEAAGADAAGAGGAGPPGAQRRHGAAGRSGAAAGHQRPGGHGSDGQGRAPALAADDHVATGGCVVGEAGRRGAA